MGRTELLRQIGDLRARLAELEEKLAATEAESTAPPNRYWAYEVTAGCILGMLGAATSLLFNVVGSLISGQEPLQLVRVFLTFPLADSALDPRIGSNLALAIGCCLYLGTGMILGVPVHLAIRTFAPTGWLRQFTVATTVSLLIWVVNFYGILSWLQPLLFGGNWIVEQIPWWVAASTHMVFGWTIWLAGPLGVFVPYQVRQETP